MKSHPKGVVDPGLFAEADMDSLQDLPLEHIVVCIFCGSLHVRCVEASIGYQHDTSEAA